LTLYACDATLQIQVLM